MKNQQGFTLIEMIIVVVLLAVTVGMTSDILMSLVRSNTKTQVLNEIEQQANFVSLKLEKELRDAIDATVSDGGATLKFTRRGDVSEEVTYHFSESDGVGILQRVVGTYDVNTNPYVPVTSSASPGGVNISCLNGSCFAVVGTNPKVVKINMLFEQAQSSAGVSYSGSAKIESSIVIRSTY
jgi:prepilin-type N-terminal cleavage/methylation domain-containing protein